MTDTPIFQQLFSRIRDLQLQNSSPITQRHFIQSMFIWIDIAIKEGKLFCDSLCDKGPVVGGQVRLYNLVYMEILANMSFPWIWWKIFLLFVKGVFCMIWWQLFVLKLNFELSSLATWIFEGMFYKDNGFHAIVLFLCPSKTSENKTFLRDMKRKPLA